jgi:hypothetical protein
MPDLLLRANRRYPSVPAVTRDPLSHAAALNAIRESLQTYERRNADVTGSFVRVQDLIDLGFTTLEASNILRAAPSPFYIPQDSADRMYSVQELKRGHSIIGVRYDGDSIVRLPSALPVECVVSVKREGASGSVTVIPY